MGQGMADNLLRAADIELTVFSRRADKVSAMAAKGATPAQSVPELVLNVDVVLACLRDVPTSRAILLDKVAPIAYPGLTIVDHATVDIATSKACAEVFNKQGTNFLDAPISGGPGGAANGTLSIMVGGSESVFEHTLPVFKAMGSNIFYMGETGAGTAMKLVNQLLVGVHSLAAAEALQFATSAGVNLLTAAKVLAVSWGGSTMMARNAPITHERNFANSAAPLRNVVKDMGIVSTEADIGNLNLPLTSATKRAFDHCLSEGLETEDPAAVIKLLEQWKPI